MRFLRTDKPSRSVSEHDICVAISNRNVLVAGNEDGMPFPQRHELPGHCQRDHLIGTLNGVPCRAVELAEDDGSGNWTSLRSLIATANEGAVAAAMTATQVLDWDRDTAYCGRCGVETGECETVRSKLCPSCGRSLFPKISPAIIVAVTRGDKILLGHNKRHADDLFSTIAGFVEPGENLEEAVRREVYEETSLVVERITYFGSQPWPFPDSLMIGFTAESPSGSIEVDGEEIIEARWFSRDNMPNIPQHGTISRKLIDAYIKGSG